MPTYQKPGAGASGNQISESKIQDMIDDSIAGFNADVGLITGWDNSGTGFTKRFTSGSVDFTSSVPHDVVHIFDTGTNVPNGVYELQFDMSGTVTGANTAMYFYADDLGAEPWTASSFPYVCLPFLPGAYSPTSGTFTVFCRKMDSNSRWFFPAYGQLPMNYSQGPKTANSFGDVGLFGSMAIKTNSRMSFFCIGSDESLTINSMTLKFTPAS